MTARKTTLIALALVTLTASLTMAQPGRGAGRGGPWHDGPGHRLERLAEALDLSEEQQTAIASIHEKARAASVDPRKELARLRNQLHGEMLADQPSESTLIDLTERMGTLRTRLQVIRLEARLAVREQLTAEQRDQMLLMGPGRGPGGCHGGCPGGCHGDGWGPGDGDGPRSEGRPGPGRRHWRGASQGPGRGQ